MRAELARVLEAIASGDPAEEWLKALPRLSAQRTMVEDHLATSDRPRVYGFDTLLGPLDSQAAGKDSQLMLLDAHLQGRLGITDRTTFAAMTAVKLEQLSLGGSGIHPSSFRGILDAFKLSEPSYTGAWNDSYSSGDVVPGSWWLKNILDHDFIPELHSGDVIALINGNFVSTATGVISLTSLCKYFANFLAVSAAFVDPTPAEVQGEYLPRALVSAIWDQRYVRPLPSSLVQRPVSVRDGRLYVELIAKALNQVAGALTERLTRSSGNPLFVMPPDGAFRSLSQVSFLGFNLTLASTAAIQSLSLCMGAVHRFTQQMSEEIQSQSVDPLQRAVQPPKISRAILEDARLRLGNLPLSFTGVESGGVEDVWDLSLSTTRILTDLIAEANSQFQPLRDLNGGQAIADAGHVDLIYRELLRNI